MTNFGSVKLALLVVAFAANAATPMPLTPQQQNALLRHYGVDRTSVGRLVAYQYGSGSDATADIFSIPMETQKGSCVSSKLEVLGEVTATGIMWTTPSSPSPIKQVVWLPAERRGASCSEMLDSATITLDTPVEESTLQRLYAHGIEIALAANGKLGDRWPPIDVRSGRLTEASVEYLGPDMGAGTYRVRWDISQCKGLSIAVETSSGDEEFRVVSAWAVVC